MLLPIAVCLAVQYAKKSQATGVEIYVGVLGTGHCICRSARLSQLYLGIDYGGP